jgi:hypothetical protein
LPVPHIAFQAAWGLPNVIVRKIKMARAARSNIPSTMNNIWDSPKNRLMPNGKISGNAIGII